jgi:multiple sugar transport system substrate-binding protein
MLTNDVQIAYSMTEGYCPVTSKAQESREYQDYLLREGEDNELYYDIKLKATKLLLENTENTFVTPVFNGSSSLRNAAGQLIENVNKSVRRKQEFNDEYISSLKDEVTSLYRLDTISITRGKENLGNLPGGSVVLICTVLLCWIVIAFYVVYDKVKTKRKNK